MAIINAPDLFSKTLQAYEANGFVEHYEVSTAANSTDSIRVGLIPAGTEVVFVFGKFADTGTGNTIDVGYEYAIPAADKTLYGVSDVANYWWNDLDTATAAVASTRSASAPIRFEYPVYLTILVNTQNLTGTPKLELDVIGKYWGPK
jgi:hypothetical protein